MNPPAATFTTDRQDADGRGREAVAGADGMVLNAMLLVILACRLAGILDAVRLGRKKDSAPPPGDPV